MNDRRNEFLGDAIKNDIIQNEYRINSKCAATENLQANSIHQVITNLIRPYDIQKKPK